LQTATPTHPLRLVYLIATLRDAGHDCVLLDATAKAPDELTPHENVLRVGLTDEQIVDWIDPEARAIAVTNMFRFNSPIREAQSRERKCRHP